jgi:hypothetical protein
MQNLAYLAGWVLVLAGGAARADEADAKAVIDKAIKAHGGAELLAKFPAMTVKTKGKFYGLGDAIEYTAESQFQAPDKQRVEVRSDNFTFLRVVNGDKGWVAANGETREMDKEQLAEARDELHATNVARLAPLTGKDFKLSSLGEVEVGGRPAVGVRVEHKGFRDVSLFFDKENGLLVKMERRGKDVMGGGGEFTQESIFSDYKKVEGVQVAFKLTAQRDGKRYIESETTEATPAEKLDASAFGKP